MINKNYTIYARMISVLMFVGLLGTTAQADEAKTPDILLYIHPQDYSTSVSLRHYYYNYWVTQGPSVESAAKKVLGQRFGEVKMCEGNNPGKTLVWLRPSIFYNPLMKQYHGKIKASVYSGDGKPLATYIGEGQAEGFLDLRADREKKIATVYQQAMESVADKMQADDALQKLLKTEVKPEHAPAPCGMVTLLPAPAVTINSF